jgi:DNA primase
VKRDLDWLRRQVDLVAIARPHLEGLKFEAGEHKALCPFHKERTPSFTIYLDNGVQKYKCFGSCGVGGDVFDFLMAAEQITRLEAIQRVEELAGTASAPLPEQGMADGYTAVEYNGKPAKDGPRYKAIGNSMAVPVLRWILRRIE